MKKVMVVVLGLVCLLMVGNVQAVDCTFSDVPVTHIFYDEITGICELGITTGYWDGTYRPSQPVTRGQMAAFIMRTSDLLRPALSHNLEAFGFGSLTYYGPPGCESTNTGCTIITEGTVTGNIIRNGTFLNNVTVLWISDFPNGSGGYCAPASGSETLTESDGSTLTVKRVGILCEVGASGSGKYTFNGSYFVTEGTGNFVGATGTGIQICSVDGSTGNVLGFAHGIFKK